MSGSTPPSTEALFRTVTGSRSVQKWSNYFDVYDRYFAPFRDKSPTIIEIGVQHGGSLLMWDAYFGGKAKIFGIDILDDTRRFETENARILVGDQSDPDFLDKIIAEVGQVDIIIDDGSHIPRHQIASFNKLFYNCLRDGGIYICEDCHTSYMPSYGGGVRKRGTFIEFSKKLADDVNALSVDSLPNTKAGHSIRAITFFTSMVVFEKASMLPPKNLSAGETRLDLERQFKTGKLAKFVMPLKKNAFIQRMVRTNPWLWSVMRKILSSGK